MGLGLYLAMAVSRRIPRLINILMKHQPALDKRARPSRIYRASGQTGLWVCADWPSVPQRVNLLIMNTFTLHSVIIQAPGSQPTVEALLIHGILGSGRNLRTLATLLCKALPWLRVHLIDLRNHGQSHGAAPPHTLQACAGDLLDYCTKNAIAPAFVLGHSYGGKVALQAAATPWPGLRQVWLLDATPEPRQPEQPELVGIADVIEALRHIPLPLPSRQAVVPALQGRGIDLPIAQWMTTNMRAVDDGFVWNFELNAVLEMLESYFETDLWPVLENPPPGLQFHLVRALREARWTPEILIHLARLPQSVQVHPLDSGHWLHVDALEPLLELLRRNLTP